jgi:hypothetical protein
MIPTIGLVVFGYVLVRMLELASNPEAKAFVRVCAVGMMIGAVVAAILLVSQAVETSRALDVDPYGFVHLRRHHRGNTRYGTVRFGLAERLNRDPLAPTPEGMLTIFRPGIMCPPPQGFQRPAGEPGAVSARVASPPPAVLRAS